MAVPTATRTVHTGASRLWDRVGESQFSRGPIYFRLFWWKVQLIFLGFGVDFEGAGTLGYERRNPAMSAGL
jgi:hypothetical protein